MPFIQLGGHRGGDRHIEPVYSEIDEDDLEKVSKYQWSQNVQSSSHTIYGITHTGGKKIHLHRLIMGLGDFKDDKRIVDHKDGNGLNNKKENLVICDTLYNSQSFRRHHGESNIGCVTIDNTMVRKKKWRAQIVINKIRHRKRFLTEQEAWDFIKDLLKK